MQGSDGKLCFDEQKIDKVWKDITHFKMRKVTMTMWRKK